MLFPSRCLTEVFSMTGGTIDGLHFTLRRARSAVTLSPAMLAH